MADLADTHRAEASGPPLATRTPVRAADADRHTTVLRLQDAVAAGRLTPGEGSRRMATAFAATHLSDLGPLTADLPPPPIMNGGPPVWRVLAMMTVEHVQSFLRGTHPARVVLALVLAVLLAVAAGVVTADLFDGGAAAGAGGFGHH